MSMWRRQLTSLPSWPENLSGLATANPPCNSRSREEGCKVSDSTLSFSSNSDSYFSFTYPVFAARTRTKLSRFRRKWRGSSPVSTYFPIGRQTGRQKSSVAPIVWHTVQPSGCLQLLNESSLPTEFRRPIGHIANRARTGHPGKG